MRAAFLDRDGVINRKPPEGEYVRAWAEFELLKGTAPAIRLLKEMGFLVLVVTNQRGVGKCVTRLDDLHTIHKNMIAEIEEAGGRIDSIYYCPDVDDTSPNRKPNPGMGLQAIKDLPDIDVNKTIMIGNTLSDMQFGRNLGVQTIFLPTTRPEVDLKDERIDAVYDSLIAFANDLKDQL